MLKVATNKTRRSIVVFIRGLPGAGKTFLAQKLQKEIGDNCLVLDPDGIKNHSLEYQLFIKDLARREPHLSPKFFPYRFLRNQALIHLKKGGLVIWDQPWSNLNGLKVTIEYLTKNLSQAPLVIIVELEIAPDKAYQRIRKRIESGGHGPSRTTFLQFVNRFRSVITSQYFENILVIKLDATNISKQTINRLKTIITCGKQNLPNSSSSN